MQTIAASQRNKIKEQSRDVGIYQKGSNRIGVRENGREGVYEEKIFDTFSEFIRSKVYSENQNELIEIISI